MQMSYSLADRWIEYEHLPAARELGIGLAAWSALRYGFLSGKYTRSPEGLAKVSAAAGEPMATVALVWLEPTSAGVATADFLKENLAGAIQDKRYSVMMYWVHVRKSLRCSAAANKSAQAVELAAIR